MKETKNKLQVSFPFGILEVKKCLLMNMCNWQEREIVDAKYNMTKLVDLAWGRENDLGVDSNEVPMEEIDVSQHQQSSFLKHVSTLNYYQIL